MRVAVYAAYYAPHVGGYCLNVHELSKRLAAEGHSVKVVTCNTDGGPGEEVLDGVNILRLPAWCLLGGQLPVPKPSRGLLRAWENRPDVVITQTRFFPTSLMGAVYAWLYPVPLIHVERGTTHSVVAGKLTGLAARLYDHLFGAVVVNRARTNIGVSEAACEMVKHLGGQHRRVIYNGVEMEGK